MGEVVSAYGITDDTNAHKECAGALCRHTREVLLPESKEPPGGGKPKPWQLPSPSPGRAGPRWPLPESSRPSPLGRCLFQKRCSQIELHADGRGMCTKQYGDEALPCECPTCMPLAASQGHDAMASASVGSNSVAQVTGLGFDECLAQMALFAGVKPPEGTWGTRGAYVTPPARHG